MVVAVFGDLNETAIAQQVERAFGALPAQPAPWPDRLPADPPAGVQTATRTLEKEQALVLLGFLGSTHTAPDRYALDVLTAILSGMAGRLFQAVREEQGLAYTLGASHVPGWDRGYLLVYAATRPQEQEKVLTALEQQLERAAEAGFTEEELEQAKRYLIGLHRLELQHLSGLAKRVTLDELYGVGHEAWAEYEARINAVTAADVHEVARRYLTLDHRAQVVVSPNGHVPDGP
jgi:zinc protease